MTSGVMPDPGTHRANGVGRAMRQWLSAPGTSARARGIAACAVLVVLAVALARTAWLCDDAYISMRVVDNALHGHGLRWNVLERVQVYTHPLWVLALLPVVALTGSVYAGALVLGAACSLGAVGLLVGGSASARTGLLVGAAAVGSMAFVDFSTSGLENPLAHLLLVGLALWLGRGVHTARDLGVGVLLGALVMVNRLDHALLVGPALAWAAWGHRDRAGARAVALGLTPLVAWEGFSLVYYGFLLPNTAYAKLPAGIPASDLVTQGIAYLANSVRWDPLTLAVVGLGVAVGAWRGPGDRALAVGIAGYVAYVVWIGGDHMAGRFLTAPFALSLAVLARGTPGPRTAPGLAVGVVVLGSMARTPPLTSGPDLNRRDLDPAGIADERGFFYRVSGWRRADTRLPVDDTVMAAEGRAVAEAGTPVVLREMIGWYGYGAGPSVHIVDPLGLGDPLLARIPRLAGTWRVGHYNRPLPEGYLDWVIGRGPVTDPVLAAYVDDLGLVTRGPLWSLDRLAAIVRLNLGGDGALQDYCARRCSVWHPKKLASVEERYNKGDFPIPRHGVAFAVRPGAPCPTRVRAVASAGPLTFAVRRGDETIATVTDTSAGTGLITRDVALPDVGGRCTSVRVFAPRGARLLTLGPLP